jgi:hypothetical protein
MSLDGRLVPPECSLPDVVDGSFGCEPTSINVSYSSNVCLPIVIDHVWLFPISTFEANTSRISYDHPMYLELSWKIRS